MHNAGHAGEDRLNGEPANRFSRCARKLDGVLGSGVESAAAAGLVLVEIVVLFSGVVARYVFHKPLVWSDELASLLFLWLSMLGAVVALRRGEHMRMTGLVNRVSPQARDILETLAMTIPLAFLALVMWPAFDYAHEEAAIVTPALEISNAWRASAIPVGLGLMLVIAILRLLRLNGFRQIGIAVLATAAVTVAFWLAGPVLAPLGKLNLIIFFVLLVAGSVFAGVPIAFSFALATFAYLALTTRTPMLVLVGRLDEGMSHLILLAVPLFIFLGALIEMTGMAKAMIQFLSSLLGHIKGGLSYVLIAITIGSVTGVSIAALFTGGLLPAVVVGACLCAVVAWRYRNDDLSQVKRYQKSEIAKFLLVALPAIALPFVIRAAVVEGVATATEVSTIGIAYSVLIGLFVHRQFDLKRIKPMLVETASLTGAIIFIVGCATAMAWGLTQSGFSQDLAAIMKTLPGGAWGFLAVSMVAFVVLGSVLEGIPAIVLFGPLLFPIARQVGVHEVHYAMVVVFAMGIGLFGPPFGVGYYGACAISKIHPDEGIKHIGGYILALLVGLVIVAAVPWFSTGFLKV